MDNIKKLVPRISEMVPHKCLWCDFVVLSVPGELHALYHAGKNYSIDEPYMLMADIDFEQKVTIFNYNGTRSRKAELKLLPEISPCTMCNDNPDGDYCESCRWIKK